MLMLTRLTVSNLIRKKMGFKQLQKLVFVVIALRSGGRTFQALGPATTNALSAVRPAGCIVHRHGHY